MIRLLPLEVQTEMVTPASQASFMFTPETVLTGHRVSPWNQQSLLRMAPRETTSVRPSTLILTNSSSAPLEMTTAVQPICLRKALQAGTLLSKRKSRDQIAQQEINLAHLLRLKDIQLRSLPLNMMQLAQSIQEPSTFMMGVLDGII
jgi:hypothetical protein